MSIDESKINKLPLINTDKGTFNTKSYNFQKYQTNILPYQLKKNFNITLRGISLKKSLINTSNDNPKLKLRSTSINVNTNSLKKNQQKILSTSQQVILNPNQNQEKINIILKQKV